MSAGLILVFQVLLGLAGVVALLVVVAGARERRLAVLPLAIVLLCGGLSVLLAAARARAAGVQACAAELHNLGAALELYAQSNDGQSPPSLDFLVPYYFEQAPHCPVAGPEEANPYQDGYLTSGQAFTVQCRGRHHQGVGGCAPDFPRFTPAAGVQTAP